MCIEEEFLGRWADETEDLFDGSFVPVYPFHVPRKETPMFDHTITLKYRSTSAKAPTVGVLSLWASDLGFRNVDALDYSHTFVVLQDPNAQIVNARLREYHARSRGFGLTTTDARHAFRHAVLGYKVPVASDLTNAQLDKIFAAMESDDD